MSFNPEVKEKMILDAENSINIFEPKITFNGREFQRDKLDNFMKTVKKFDLKILENIKKYDDKLKNEINLLIYSVDTIQDYLNL